MKRLLQLVSIVVILLLAGQPAMLRADCAWGSGSGAPCVAQCPMGMGQMGMDCQMADQMASTGCPLNCCQSALQPAVARAAAPNRPRLAISLFVTAVLPVAAEAQAGILVRPPGERPIFATERHILLQVFRI